MGSFPYCLVRSYGHSFPRIPPKSGGLTNTGSLCCDMSWIQEEGRRPVRKRKKVLPILNRSGGEQEKKKGGSKQQRQQGLQEEDEMSGLRNMHKKMSHYSCCQLHDMPASECVQSPMTENGTQKTFLVTPSEAALEVTREEGTGIMNEQYGEL